MMISDVSTTTRLTTAIKGEAHRAWLNDLRNRPRDEAAKLIAERLPHLREAELQRRLKYLDTPPAPAIKADTSPTTKRVKKARNSLFRAMAHAMDLSAQQRADAQRASNLKSLSTGSIASRRPVP